MAEQEKERIGVVKIMEIRTKRLVIVPIDTSFLDSTCEFAIGREHIRMMVYFPKDNRGEVLEYLQNAEAEFKKEQPDFCEYAVMLGNKHIGIISMYFEGQYDRGELGWIIRREYRGNGYAVEAAEGLMQYFCENYGIKRFIAQCDIDNIASKRVIEKLGMNYVETHGGRFNRGSDEERKEEKYQLTINN